MLYALVAEATATTTSSVRQSGSDFRILGRLQSLLNLTFKEASLPDPPRVAKATAPELATPPAPERWSAELTAGAPGKQWHPTCLAELAHKPPSTCVHGPRTFNCTYTWADFLRSQPHLGASGAWESKGTTPYLLDRGLATALARFFGASASVVEFGAGKGCYTDALRTAGLTKVQAFEGAPQIEHVTHGFVRHADLSKTGLRVGPADWVLCLEVAEHVPLASMPTFLANLDAHNTKGIVMSWSSAKNGNGHVNPQPDAFVTVQMRLRNYTEDKAATHMLKAAATTYSWFRTTASHGVPGGGVRVWRRGATATPNHLDESILDHRANVGFLSYFMSWGKS